MLVAGVTLVAASMIGPAMQGAIAGPQEWWPRTGVMVVRDSG